MSYDTQHKNKPLQPCQGDKMKATPRIKTRKCLSAIGIRLDPLILDKNAHERLDEF